jgi:hypothetical protein
VAQVYPTTPAWGTPVVHELSFTTGIATGIDGTEQRWMLSPGVESWTLPYTYLALADRDAILAVFEACKGAYDQTVSLMCGTTNYTGLSFDADELVFTEQAGRPTLWSGSVKLTTAARAVDTGALASSFPVLLSGAVVQLPFTHAENFDTASVRTEGGRYAYARRLNALRRWAVGGAALTDTEAQALWDYYRLNAGRWRSFLFRDPDSGTVYSSRFASDRAQWRVLGPNENDLRLEVQQLVS